MTYRIPPAIACAFSPAEDTYWLLRVGVDECLGLTTVAHTIWRASDGAVDSDAVVDALVADQGWSREEIAEPVRELVAEMLSAGYLEEAPA